MVIHKISTIMLFNETFYFLLFSSIFIKNNRNSFFVLNSFIINSKALISIDMIFFYLFEFFFLFVV